MDIDKYLHINFVSSPFTTPIKTEIWGDNGSVLSIQPGNNIFPEDSTGEFDFISRLRDAPLLQKPFIPNLMNELLLESRLSLVQLSTLCKEDTPEFRNITTFWSGKGLLRQMIQWPGFETFTLMRNPDIYAGMMSQRQSILESLYPNDPINRTRFNRVFSAVGTMIFLSKEDLIKHY